MMDEDLRIAVKSDPQLLAVVRTTVRRYFECMGFDKPKTDDVVLAVDEACANSIRHAYDGDSAGEYELTLSSDGATVELRISDKGTPAPAERVVKQDLSRQAEEEKLTPGGLGVQFMYEVFDEVQFCPGTTRGNCVILKLSRPAKADE